MLAKISGIFKRRYAVDELIGGDIKINKVSRTVCKNDVPLNLTAKEFDLLLLLIEYKGKSVGAYNEDKAILHRKAVAYKDRIFSWQLHRLLLSGDYDRSIEVIQNLMENVIKYGDGKSISLDFSEEDGCILVTVKNNCCTLVDTNLPHIFDSFWRAQILKPKREAVWGFISAVSLSKSIHYRKSCSDKTAEYD